MNRRVDFYFSKAPKWQEALEQLRTFLLACVPALKTAFNALTPGQQRAYLLYFAAPKQAKTRAARAEKWVPQILQGKGLQE
ncbi:MAG: hypothetical protein JWR44_1880 [Hymenobacter sp.]|jgi:uncharacterized protein YdeI (YjbR/CyaY-like superfamily)|nr:hypothetical protein [Hymenobacter sp.]